jgi:hypothetical protein
LRFGSSVLHNEQTGSNGIASGLYFEDAQFESLPAHRLSSKVYHGVPQSIQANAWISPKNKATLLS